MVRPFVLMSWRVILLSLAIVLLYELGGGLMASFIFLSVFSMLYFYGYLRRNS